MERPACSAYPYWKFLPVGKPNGCEINGTPAARYCWFTKTEGALGAGLKRCCESIKLAADARPGGKQLPTPSSPWNALVAFRLSAAAGEGGAAGLHGDPPNRMNCGAWLPSATSESKASASSGWS